MRRIVTFVLVLALILILGSTSRAANLVTYSLTVTNIPATSNVFYWAAASGSLRTWTNATTANTILTNIAGINQSATNLFNALANYPLLGITLGMTNTNTLTFRGSSITVTQGGNWASVSSSSLTGTNVYEFVGPYNLQPLGTRQMQASESVYGEGAYSTNAFPTNATALSNFLSLGIGSGGGTQTVVAPKYFASLSGVINWLSGGYWTNGILDVVIISNSPSVTASNLWATNVHLGAGGSFANVFIDSPNMTNAQVYGQLRIDTNTATGAQATLTFGHNFSFYYSPATTMLSAVSDDTSTTIFTLAGPRGAYFTQPLEVTNTLRVRYGTTSDTNSFTSTSLSNSIVLGTNQWTGDIAYVPITITSMAAGANADVPGTNVLVEITGTPGAAWSIAGITGGRAGRVLTIVNLTGYAMSVLNESGSEPTPGSRIKTLLGTDLVTGTNSVVDLFYSGSLSHWVLRNHFP